MIFIISYLISGIVFGAICEAIKKNTFFWGFLFGIFGVLIVACTKGSNSNLSNYESLEKLENLRKNGTITQAEFDIERNKIMSENKSGIGAITLIVIIVIIVFLVGLYVLFNWSTPVTF